MALTYIAIVVSLVGSIFCWWDIAHSGHSPIFKIVLAAIAAIPFFGPFLYLFADMPSPRTRAIVRRSHDHPKKESAFLRRWNEREHIYLGWASFVFWALALVAYWMNDWKPGRIIDGRFGTYTEVDVIFFVLLIGAVCTLGLAVRAKVYLLRELRAASNLLRESSDHKAP